MGAADDCGPVAVKRPYGGAVRLRVRRDDRGADSKHREWQHVVVRLFAIREDGSHGSAARALLVEGPDGDVPVGQSGTRRWFCLCDCGNRCIKTQDWFRAPASNLSCGCRRGRRGTDDRIGLVLGRLTVLEQVADKSGRAHYRCRCECGGGKVAGSNALALGSTLSCGCLSREAKQLPWGENDDRARFRERTERMREDARVAWASRTHGHAESYGRRRQPVR